MPLSAKEAASIESLGGVFHNRRRTMEDFSGEVCQISVAFGFVDAASSPSDKKIVAHPMFIGRRRRGRIPLYPTISRHIPVYPGISRIPFFVRGHPGGRELTPTTLTLLTKSSSDDLTSSVASFLSSFVVVASGPSAPALTFSRLWSLVFCCVSGCATSIQYAPKTMSATSRNAATRIRTMGDMA